MYLNSKYIHTYYIIYNICIENIYVHNRVGRLYGPLGKVMRQNMHVGSTNIHLLCIIYIYQYVYMSICKTVHICIHMI